MDYIVRNPQTGMPEPLIPHIDDFLAGHAQARNLAMPSSPPQQPQIATTPSSARAQICAAEVANTPELAEHILKHLSARQLVSATRVNQTFRSLIHTSPTLQRITFMRSRRPNTPTQHCQFVQWGPGLQQRHLKPLPHSSAANDTAIQAWALPQHHQSFKAMTILYRHAVPMSLLCPLLEPAESGSMHTWNTDLDASLTGVSPPVRMTARFSEKLLLVPASAWAVLQISAHGATPSTSASTLRTARENPWPRMQLSTPPTRHAHVKLCWEGRLNGELRVSIEATRCMHRFEWQSGITLQSLIYHASSSLGFITIREIPIFSHVFNLEEMWGMTTRENSSLAKCINDMVQTEPGRSYVWTLGAQSEVTLHGVVVPTEGELELLAESEQLSSTAVPLVFHFMGPGAEEEDGEEDGQGQQGDDDNDDDADDDEEEEEDGSESGSDSVVE
ncbi:hypothetical protein MBLNU13_g07179t1 [Cladosporium sp. NU13]